MPYANNLETAAVPQVCSRVPQPRTCTHALGSMRALVLGERGVPWGCGHLVSRVMVQPQVDNVIRAVLKSLNRKL